MSRPSSSRTRASMRARLPAACERRTSPSGSRDSSAMPSTPSLAAISRYGQSSSAPKLASHAGVTSSSTTRSGRTPASQARSAVASWLRYSTLALAMLSVRAAVSARAGSCGGALSHGSTSPSSTSAQRPSAYSAANRPASASHSAPNHCQCTGRSSSHGSAPSWPASSGAASGSASSASGGSTAMRARRRRAAAMAGGR